MALGICAEAGAASASVSNRTIEGRRTYGSRRNDRTAGTALYAPFFPDDAERAPP
jgi:hypothetical protein